MILLVALGIGNFFAYNYSTVITNFLCGTGEDFSDAKLTLKESDALCQTIGDESMVLLKNQDNVLPLYDYEYVNVFGWGATDEGFLLKGVGSGSSTISTKKQVTLLDAFDESDEYIEYNQDIIDFYMDFGENNKNNLRFNSSLSSSNVFKLAEPSVEDLKPLIEDAQLFSDVAIFVISRCGGENLNGSSNGDLPAGYLDITEAEQATLDLIKESFETVIVLLNTTNTMHTGFLEDEKIDAAIYVGITGQSAATAIPRILTGEISPSGKLADTMTYYDKYDPTYANIKAGSNQYVEDIYYGYKWYETADTEGYWNGVDNSYGKGYDGVVQFPFGYGLSYTDFTWDISSLYVLDAEGNKLPFDYSDAISLDGISPSTTFYLDVKVTNVGEYFGKDVVELYYTPPYVKGEVEKASINLLDFAKTSEELDPGDAMTVTMSFTPYDLASYDCYDKNKNGSATYELDAGEYTVQLMTDSHNLKNDASKITFTLTNDVIIDTDPITGSKVENRLTGESAYLGLEIDALAIGGASYMTRADFVGTFPKQAAPRPSGSIINEANQAYNDAPFEALPPVNTGKSNNLYLATLEGGEKASLSQLEGSGGAKLVWNYELMSDLIDYDSPTWDQLLDQLSAQEMKNLIELGGFRRIAIESVGKPLQKDYDGPAGFNTNSLTGSWGGESVDTETWTAYPSEALMGCSWNKDLMFMLGRSMGAEADATAIEGWYAPGVNLHRNAYLGRNFEYYSEDGVLSGKLAAKVIYGAKTNGLVCYLKHFVCSDTGNNPRGTDTWLTEQNLRENVLKPFEIAVKEGGSNGIMSAFNDLGSVWCGANYALLTEILRGEWGFRGTVLTDWTDSSNRGSMSVRQGIRAGNDLWLNPTYSINGNDKIDTNNQTDLKAARIACKNILYSVVDTELTAKEYRELNIEDVYQTSGTIEFKEEVFAWWIPALIGFDIICGVALVVLFFKKKY